MTSIKSALAAKADVALDVDGIVTGIPRVAADAREVSVCLDAAKQARRTLMATSRVSKARDCGGAGVWVSLSGSIVQLTEGGD